jgi:predicted Zn-dependent peptidase
MITSDKGNIFKYAVRKGGNAVAYCSLSIRCGTRDEEGFHSGIAHFVEHTIFKGTAKKSARVINGYLDKLGGELNAFTTKEEIVLHATVLKEDLDKAADLLFELTTSATFPENEIETEKGVVLDEIQSYKDSPSEDIYDKFEEMFFEGHPLSGLILGTTVSVKKISREELLRFTKEKFIPSNMAFSIVADLDEKVMEKKVKKLISKYFPTLEETQKKEIPEFTYEPKIFDKTLNKRNHQVNCIIGGLAPSLYKTKERVATVLLVNILGGPANNSLLNATLREKYGWVYGVECSYNQYSDCGLVTISLGCDKDNLDKCLHHTKKIIAKLQECELSDKKLREAKKQLLGQLAISSDNGETQCLSLGKSLLAFGIVNSDSATKKIIEEITSKDLQEMAQTIFDPSKTSKLIYI